MRQRDLAGVYGFPDALDSFHFSPSEVLEGEWFTPVNVGKGIIHQSEDYRQAAPSMFTAVNMSPSLIVRDAIEKLKLEGFTQKDIAARLEVSEATISSYLKGRQSESGDSYFSNPTLKTWTAALAVLGGDISRAYPGYQPAAANAPQKPLHVVGAVQAGSSTATFQIDEYHPDLDFLWRRSSGWALSKGPVSYIRVVGDSMEPAYPENCIIAVRQWNELAIPHSTPVVFLDKLQHSSTLKLYQTTTRNGKPFVIGVPINPIHQAVVWSASNVQVQFIVLGKAEALSGRELRQGGNHFVLRDSADTE